MLARGYVVINFLHQEEPLSLYINIGMSATDGKSALLTYLIKFVNKLVEAYNVELTGINRKIEAANLTLKTEISMVRKELRLKKISTEECSAQINRLMSAMCNSVAPLAFFINDNTPEGMAIRLHEQHGWGAVFDAEKGIYKHVYQLERSPDLLLQAWSGEYFDRVRATGKNASIVIPRPQITIFKLVNKHILKMVYNSKELLDNGFLARTLSVIHPEPINRDSLHISNPVSEAGVQWFE